MAFCLDDAFGSGRRMVFTIVAALALIVNTLGKSSMSNIDPDDSFVPNY
jgi:hypothetical protein